MKGFHQLLCLGFFRAVFLTRGGACSVLARCFNLRVFFLDLPRLRYVRISSHLTSSLGCRYLSSVSSAASPRSAYTHTMQSYFCQVGVPGQRERDCIIRYGWKHLLAVRRLTTHVLCGPFERRQSEGSRWFEDSRLVILVVRVRPSDTNGRDRFVFYNEKVCGALSCGRVVAC